MLRRHHLLRRRLTAPLVRGLILLQCVAAMPVAAQQASRTPDSAQAQSPDSDTPPRESEKAVVANRTVPDVTPPSATLRFSAAPTVEEIFRAQVFPEPLVPVGGTPGARETAALAQALTVFHARREFESIAPLQIFLEQHPFTPWRASLLVNIATVLRQAGAFSSAMETADTAWNLAKDATDPYGRAVADLAIAEWLTIAATFGQAEVVKARYESLGSRDVRGPAGARVARARETVGLLRSRPQGIIASGPEAVRVLWKLRNGPSGSAWIETSGLTADFSRRDPDLPNVLRSHVPTSAGTSLAQVAEFARQSGLRMRMARRVDARDVPVPSIMHWRLGHFSAVVQREGDRYQVIDIALGSRWVSRATLMIESSGFFLLPAGSETGWSDVSATEASTVIGHSCPPGGPPPNPPCTNPCCCPPPGSGPPPGMPTYSLNHVTASLTLYDQPTTYVAPRGPDVTFRLAYNHRDELQPQIFTYANLGPLWTFRWARFVQESPQVCSVSTCQPAFVWVQMEVSGREVYSNPTAQGVFPAHWSSKAVLVRTSAAPLRYERRLNDGSVEVYGQPDAAPAGQQRVYLTQIIDPQGLSATVTWDAQYRPVAVTDAVGQVSTFAYEHATDPLKVTKYSDPYGRSATLAYTAAGQLASVTDTLGLTTTFAYGAGDFISAMRTPYGVTTFRHESSPNDYYVKRFIEATDPLGGTEHVEFRWHEEALATTAPSTEVPTGFSAWNDALDWYNTVYWDKRAWAMGPNDLSKATVTKWMTAEDWPGGPFFSSPVPHSVKKPLENRVWYKYASTPTSIWTFKEPTVVARVLDDGASQIREYAYNSSGQMTLKRDPLGRETTYEFATNGVDLIAVRQKNGGTYDLLETRTHNAQHRPVTITDASGETTTFTYNAAGQVLTVTNAKNETTTYAYDADGRVLSMTGPVSGAVTTYTYDSHGRPSTVTDPDNYTITTGYDVFDRPTLVTYPDGTTEVTSYDRLDVATRRDRRGRVTRLFYDALQRVTATRDPLGRTVRQEWCTCGALDALIDAKGNRTRWERDLQARVTKEIRADNREILYVFEAGTGRLASMTDAKQQMTAYSYFLDDRLQGLTFTNEEIATPDVSYTYDTTYGRVATMIDGAGTTTYTYHATGIAGATQVATVDGPLADDAISYTYDELGRVVTRAVNGAANTVTWTLDALGRIATEVNVQGTFTYEYDSVTDRIQMVTYPNGQTSTYSYLGNSHDRRLDAIHHKYPNASTLSKLDYTYDVVGNTVTLRQQSEGNPAVQWSYGYDAADQLTSALQVTTTTPISVLKRYAYSYDSAGNRTTEQIDDVVTGATHNDVNELVAHQPAGGLIVAGTLNEPATVTIAGQPAIVTPDNQFRAVTPVVAGTNTISVAATDGAGNVATRQYQVNSAGAGKAFAYDANENLTTDGSRTFEWDARNQLTAVTVGTQRTEFKYDGLQRRVRVVEKLSGVVQDDTHVVWCENVICEERGPDGTTVKVRSFTHGQQVAAAARFLVGDGLGSITEVTDSSGALLGRYAFDPWGRRTVFGADSTDAGFAGQRQGPGSLSLSWYRAYDSDLGRWLSADPVRFRDGPNAHVYVSNRATITVDPDGQAGVVLALPWIAGGLAGGVTAGQIAAVVTTGLIVTGVVSTMNEPRWPTPPAPPTTALLEVPGGPPLQCPLPPKDPCLQFTICMKGVKGALNKARCLPLLVACIGNFGRS